MSSLIPFFIPTLFLLFMLNKPLFIINILLYNLYLYSTLLFKLVTFKLIIKIFYKINCITNYCYKNNSLNMNKKMILMTVSTMTSPKYFQKRKKKRNQQ
jgi:hypothetical protein